MLSGGQKARLSLARAIYRDADIYVLDDPFSALDKRVAQQVMNKCVLEYLKGKTVIIVTHQTQLLLCANNVYHLEHSRCTKIDKDKIEPCLDEEKTDIPMNINEEIKDSEEISKTGLSSFKTYQDYFKSGSPSLFLFSLLLFVLMFYLKLLMDQVINEFGSKKWNCRVLFCVLIIVLLIIILEVGRQFAFYINISFCSINLHNNMLFKVMSAPIRFFHINPKGRILNRFSRDLGFIDSMLHLYLELLIIVPGGILMSIGLAISKVMYLAIPTALFICALGFAMIKITIYGSELKRIESIRANPIYELLDNALKGVVSIRCFEKKKYFLSKMYHAMNSHASAYHILQAYYLFAEYVYFFIIIILQVITIFVCLYLSTPENAFIIGLAISYLINFMLALQYTMRTFTLFDGIVGIFFFHIQY